MKIRYAVAACQTDFPCPADRGEIKERVDRIDYVEIRDADSLRPVERLDRPAVILVAAYVGATRLIDNMRLP